LFTECRHEPKDALARTRQAAGGWQNPLPDPRRAERSLVNIDDFSLDLGIIYLLHGFGLMTPSRVASRTKAEKVGEVERVYRILRELLVAAEIAPGDFLSEGELAGRLKTSRTPVREACARLMQDHWLSRIRRKGFMVTPISVRDIVEMYEYRKVLEGFTAEKVAQSANVEQIDDLKNLVSAETDPEGELSAILHANERFHLRLAQLAANHRVLGQLTLTMSYVSRLDTLCTQTVPGWIGHADILRAIEAHQPADAKHAMEVHIDVSRDKMLKLFSS
jgi:DNA-binding GntR family transcriptional regulator